MINSRSNSPLTLGNAVYVALTTSQFQARPVPRACHDTTRAPCSSSAAGRKRLLLSGSGQIVHLRL